MATSVEYEQRILGLLNPIYPVQARHMFGGVGIYSGGLMFALISGDDVLYFKVDEGNRSDYQDAGMPQFLNMPYYRVPDGVMASPEDLDQWMERSIAAAQRLFERQKGNKTKRRRRPH